MGNISTNNKKFGPPPGILITERDLNLLSLLKYGCLSREQLYKEGWKISEGSQINNNKDITKNGSYDNFKKRIKKLIDSEYIKQEHIPTVNPFNKGSRTVLIIGEAGIRELNERGEDVPSAPPKINPFAIKHELMVTNAHKRLHEDVKKLDKYIAYYYEIKNEYEIIKDNKGRKRGAVYPDLSLTLTLLGKDETGSEIRIVRMVYVEVDGSSISPRDYVEKIAALSNSPIVKFEEKLDKHVVYVLSNDRKRIDSLAKVIRYNKTNIPNWKDIGFSIFYDVINYGFFPLFLPNANTIFLNCDNNEVDIIRKDEIY